VPASSTWTRELVESGDCFFPDSNFFPDSKFSDAFEPMRFSFERRGKGFIPASVGETFAECCASSNPLDRELDFECPRLLNDEVSFTNVEEFCVRLTGGTTTVGGGGGGGARRFLVIVFLVIVTSLETFIFLLLETLTKLDAVELLTNSESVNSILFVRFALTTTAAAPTVTRFSSVESTPRGVLTDTMLVLVVVPIGRELPLTEVGLVFKVWATASV